ncbi:hypothetical protein OROGR_001169 [Orobanche gracilis]
MARLHGSFSSFSGGMAALMATEDYQEEDVWDGLMWKGSSSCRIRKSRSGPIRSAWRSPATIPRSTSAAAGLRDICPARKGSSPVEIPDRSGIPKVEPKNTWWDDDGNDDVDACGDDDDDDEMVPPHEFLARRIRTSQVAYSMCEGIGRTLKGRDLCNLRNAILAKTGFLESSSS